MLTKIIKVASIFLIITYIKGIIGLFYAVVLLRYHKTNMWMGVDSALDLPDIIGYLVSFSLVKQSSFYSILPFM